MFLITNLVPNTVYYALVTAVNSKGEGYKNQKPSMIRTMSASFSNPSSLYVWGSNSHSEIGLSEDLVNANIKFYQKSKDKACLIKGIKHDNFDKIVQQVACGHISTTVLCSSENNETFIVQMGSASVL
jgi:alpha-tubulin suppressor-like RCC1 family protein